ncbi:MAG: alpha/beta hydrolase fold protein [uncultured bacterium]|nr:MAG: alpha/beta hydrolase fold protein [uncultured bacterium]
MQTVINGVRTHYEVFNPKKKNTIVILHGWGSSLTFWIPIAKQISPDIRVVLVDLPGFGSTGPIDATPDVPEYTDFIRHFAKKLKLHRFILAGHSFGGQITLDYAVKYPGDLASIILIAPVSIPEDKRLMDLKVKIADSIKPMMIYPQSKPLEQYVGWYSPEEYTNANEHQKKVLHKIISYNLKPSLNRISVPTEIIWGNLDAIVPNVGELLEKSIPHSHLHLIAGAGHLLNLTHTKELARIINRVVSQFFS